MVPKIRTDLSILSGVTGDSIPPEKRIPRKKSKIKSLASLPPRKYPIPNLDKNNLGIEKDQSLPPHIHKFPPGFKSLRNEADDDHHESTDTSRTDKDDTSSTDKDESLENLKSTNNKNSYDKYKEKNLQHQHGNESVINKTKEEEALIKPLMSTNFQQKQRRINILIEDMDTKISDPIEI